MQDFFEKQDPGAETSWSLVVCILRLSGSSTIALFIFILLDCFYKQLSWNIVVNLLFNLSTDQ